MESGKTQSTREEPARARKDVQAIVSAPGHPPATSAAPAAAARETTRPWAARKSDGPSWIETIDQF